MPEKYILTIDQSTQATKLILFDQHMQLVWKANLPHKQIVNDQGWISHDLNEIKNNLNELFKMVLKRISPDQLTGLAITNQRESAAAW